jgi:hypothetical protein
MKRSEDDEGSMQSIGGVGKSMIASSSSMGFSLFTECGIVSASHNSNTGLLANKLSSMLKEAPSSIIAMEIS